MSIGGTAQYTIGSGVSHVQGLRRKCQRCPGIMNARDNREEYIFLDLKEMTPVTGIEVSENLYIQRKCANADEAYAD